jgi:two-component system, NarL family, response regulator NreC
MISSVAPDTALDTITIVLADDHRMVRAALRLLLETQEDFAVVADVGDAVSALQSVRDHRPSILVLDLGAPSAEPQSNDGRRGLTVRELEVLRLIALGHTNPEVAGLLTLSVRTVESHRAHIQRKLASQGRADLVRYALDHHLLAA